MHLPKLQRVPELDALRGIFLAWMILVHLPTHFSNYLDQPFGFVSSAEGFVFLSAVLVGRIYYRQHMLDQKGVRTHLWRRSLKIYAYHMALLAFAFTVLAVYAVHT
ncbi:MAG: OpgC domain-containing protein, partial [Acidobacteriaceae bacterium]